MVVDFMLHYSTSLKHGAGSCFVFHAGPWCSNFGRFLEMYDNVEEDMIPAWEKLSAQAHR